MLRARAPRLLATLLTLIASACAARPEPLQRPNGVAPLPDGSLAIMDFGNYRVVQATAAGHFLHAFGAFGDGADQIFFGWDMAVDANGNYYFCNLVGDDNYTRADGVKVFSPQGQLLREIGAKTYGPEETRHYSPYGLDVDNAGRIYIADYGTGTIRVFAPDGALLAEWFGEEGAGPGQFDGLNDVAVDDERGWLYAVDAGNSRVQRFRLGLEGGALTATFERAFGAYGRGAGDFAYPQNIAVHEAGGRVLVTEIANRRVQIFDADLNSIAMITTPAEVDDWQVLGVNVGDDGTVYVADALNDSVWVFDAGGGLPTRLGDWP